MGKKLWFVFLFFTVAAFCIFADPVEGLWKSIDEKTQQVTGVWKIYEKDGKLFGEMVMTKGYHPQGAVTACKETYKDFPKKGRVNKMPLVGTPFIYNLIKNRKAIGIKGISLIRATESITIAKLSSVKRIIKNIKKICSKCAAK